MGWQVGKSPPKPRRAAQTVLSFGARVDMKNAQRWEETSGGYWKLSPAVSVLPGFKRCPSSVHLTQGRQTDRWAAAHF